MPARSFLSVFFFLLMVTAISFSPTLPSIADYTENQPNPLVYNDNSGLYAQEFIDDYDTGYTDSGHVATLNTKIKPQHFTTDKGFDGWKVHIPEGLPLATPAVDDKNVYLGGGFGSYSFYAIDRDSGELAWYFAAGDDGPTAAVVYKNRVVFNTESCIIYILDTATGQTVWSEYLGDPLMSQPAVAFDKVYMTYPGSDGYHHLTCRDLETGKEFWNQQLSGELISAPIVEGDSVYGTTLDGTVYRFGAFDGELIWKEQKFATSAPWIMGDEIFVTMRQEKTEDGKTCQTEGQGSLGKTQGEQNQPELWAQYEASYLSAETNQEYADSLKQLDANVGFGTAPASAKLEAASENLGISTVSGAWSFQGSRLLVQDGNSYNSQGDFMRCVDAKNGDVLWEKEFKPAKDMGGRCLTPPSMAGGYLFVGSSDGEIICINAKDGSQVWSYNVEEPIRFQPAVVDGKVYFTTDLGNLFCIDTGDTILDGWYMWGGNSAHNGWGQTM
jgi:outer membrane protein assembly factor BamB